MAGSPSARPTRPGHRARPISPMAIPTAWSSSSRTPGSALTPRSCRGSSTRSSRATATCAAGPAASGWAWRLSDAELPDGSGLELMRELNARGGMPGIAMSGFGAEEDLQLSREAGFLDHLTKPIDLKRLDAAIHLAAARAAGREVELVD